MIKANQAISGKEGTVFATVGSNRFEMAELKTISAQIAVKTANVQAIGMRMEKGKVVGAAGTGDLTAHYFSNVARQAIATYVKTGVYPDITIKITNADVQAQKGRHTVLLKEVIFNDSILAALDGTSEDTLEESSSFTFGDFDILETFK